MAIATLAEVKTYLGVADTSQDVFLQAQIELLTDAIESYCGRSFSVKQYLQTFYPEDIRGGALTTAIYPLISIDSIYTDTIPAIDVTGFKVHKPTGRIEAAYGFGNWGSYFDLRIGSPLMLKYTAGFVTPPAPVKAALLQLVKDRYTKQTSGIGLDFGSDVQSVSIPGTISISYDQSLRADSDTKTFGLLLGAQANSLAYYRSDRAIVGSGARVYVEEVI